VPPALGFFSPRSHPNPASPNPRPQELMGGLTDAAGAARRSLAGTGDAERTLARLAASAGGEGGGVVRGAGGFGGSAAARMARWWQRRSAWGQT
jgi:hypothetical protein